MQFELFLTFDKAAAAAVERPKKNQKKKKTKKQAGISEEIREIVLKSGPMERSKNEQSMVPTA